MTCRGFRPVDFRLPVAVIPRLEVMIRVSCEPLVTIGVPFLNPGQWFVDAIKSILHRHTNWEADHGG